jgi:hypothetical protein
LYNNGYAIRDTAPKKDKTSLDHEAGESNQLEPRRAVGRLEARINAVANAIPVYHNQRDTHEKTRSKNENAAIIALFATSLFAFLAVIVPIVSA